MKPQAVAQQGQTTASPRHQPVSSGSSFLSRITALAVASALVGRANAGQRAGKVWSLNVPPEGGALQELSTAIVSDCELSQGQRWKTSASQAILNVFNKLNIEVESQSQYSPPSAIGMKTFKGYELAEDSPWPIARVGVKGANNTLVKMFTEELKTNLSENKDFQAAKKRCALDATIGTSVVVVSLLLSVVSCCLCAINRNL